MSVLRNTIWIAWAENIALVFIISFAFYTTLPIKTTQTLFVPQGSIGNIISQLTKKGYELSKIDAYILRLIGTPKSGWVYIGENEQLRHGALVMWLRMITDVDEITNMFFFFPVNTDYTEFMFFVKISFFCNI